MGDSLKAGNLSKVMDEVQKAANDIANQVTESTNNLTNPDFSNRYRHPQLLHLPDWTHSARIPTVSARMSTVRDS